MAIIRDMMPGFEVFQPASVDDALALLARLGDRAWVLAGGLDSFDWFKERIRRPEAVVDIGGLSELRGIRDRDGGLEIGALTSLTRVLGDERVRGRYRLLAEAALAVATPQIRNQGSLGGNVSQDTRCAYYRGGWPCYRAGGNVCYADTPTSMNREHCIFGADRCVAVNPSDTAPALIALGATMVVRGRGGERELDAEDYFQGPAIDITRMTVLRPGELLTAIRLPEAWAGQPTWFEKARDRQAWDFPLVNVAAALRLEGDVIRDARLCVNAVAPQPYRLRHVERQIIGQRRSEDLAEAAGDVAVQGAAPLTHNAYKIPLMRNLVKRALRNAYA